MKLTWENRSSRRKTSPGATLTTTNPTYSEPVLNPCLRGGRPATNRLSHGTAFVSCYYQTVCPVLIYSLWDYDLPELR
jgi:hypothetical protein